MRSEYVLEMLKIDKEFPGVKALQQVTFQLRKGEIHGLVGENGAGKSTLMKILAGIYSPDRGEIRFEGQVQNRLTPRLVAQKGIHFIHQERHVVPYLTVAETLFLGLSRPSPPSNSSIGKH
ncbi:ATP-binding cassette domain-containing protein [Cohnella laeviribosi]|uniref:ATP-binding cassette domain-containing protein n=1 Tax=Cohnella laeviribosi TaxID=380174 RepID=UPI0012EC1CE5|nr:ATP-binding cassette domain-containing protein [Cohnella laeviribosi]